jgi:hypothetical protein
MFATNRVILAATVGTALIVVTAARPQPPAATRMEAVVVKAGAVQTVQMKSGKPIRLAKLSNEGIAQVAVNDQDPKILAIRGLKPGVSRLLMNDGEADESLVVAVEEPAANDKTVRQKLAQGLHDALKSERDADMRLALAEALIRVAPDDSSAASELVSTMTSGNENAAEAAYLALNRVIVESPPALVSALIPLLKDRDDATRRHAVSLLVKVDPKLLP